MNNHIWLPYTQMKNHAPQLEVESALGSKIFLKDGRVLIDGIASWWSVAHGYQHPHIVASMQKQLAQLSHIMLAGFAVDATYQLASRLAEFTKMPKVFFSDSGSTAIEVAMKMAWQYHINLGNPQKTKFISFKNSYHGDTTGAMSLADLENGMHQKFRDKLLENFSLDFPQNQNDLDKLAYLLHIKKNEIAAIFVEPLVQCAGGMKFSNMEMLSKIHQIAKENNVLFIADECAVGFYRLGKKLACDLVKITPDILILGKALTGGMLTLAASLTSQEIYDSFLDDSLDKALMHGPTFMGNPLACAAANASLDLFESENYEEKTHEIEKFLQENLIEFKSNKNVKDVRVLGAIGVIETDFDFEKMKEMRQKFIEKGVFLRPFAGVIYLMPALTIQKSELEKIIDAIKFVLPN